MTATTGGTAGWEPAERRPGGGPGGGPGDLPNGDPEGPTGGRPDRPAASRRLLAWLVDFSVVVAAAVGLGFLTYHRIAGLVTDVPALSERGVWQLLTSRGDVLEAAESLGVSVWGSIVLAVQQAFAALIAFAFLYHFLCVAFGGRTLGKALADLRVVPEPDGATQGGRVPRRRAALRAAVTTVADVATFSVACCLLVDGQFLLSVLCWAVAVALFWANALPAAGGRGRSLADRLAGTAVTGGGLLRAAARVTADGGRAAWQASQQAGQRVGQAGQQVGRQLGQQAGRIGRQVASSDRGRAALDRARSAARRRRHAGDDGDGGAGSGSGSGAGDGAAV
ncbi:RDD family protein [Streptomyces sp. 4N509B]|uniref:RDD family protein n=1 Tax=Streptomyces sp. 4N509B TaxID=3457413 RepID=UPI003FD313C9